MDKEIIDDIRRFNRFYATVIGMLDSKISNTEYSITEARVLFEIREKNGEYIANDLVAKLNIDRSYMSRILRKLKKDELIEKKRSLNDSRKNSLSITDDGIKVLEHVNDSTDAQILKLFNGLTKDEVLEIRDDMYKIQQYLDK